MKVTRICLLKADKHHTDTIELMKLIKVFCSSMRYAFNRLLEGEPSGVLIKFIVEKFHLNKRFSEDAVMQAQAIMKSQKELLPIRIEGVQAKIEKTVSKLEDYQTGKKTSKKVPLDVCLSGLQARLTKLREKELELLKHQENGTIPTVIFGGKKQFYQRMKNKITKEEWQELRSGMLYSRGDKSKGGNLNMRIVFDDTDGQFYLEVANPLVVETGKYSPRIRFNIRIPDKYYDELVNVVLPTINGVNTKRKPIEEYKVYSVEIKRKNGLFYVHVTYDLEVTGSELKWNEKITSERIAGIDVNIDKVAVSILTKQGNLLESKTFYCHEMEYVNSNRRTNISSELAKEIIDYLIGWNVGAMVLENIKLRQDHDTNKRFNRLVHNFAKNKLQKALVSRGIKCGLKIKKVNPAYTSVIGRFKYTKLYGLSVHEAASFVIGRRGLDFDENIPKKLLKQIRSLVKPQLIKVLGSMEESEKKSNNGKQRRKYIGMLLKNIEDFKTNHSWMLWFVIHKTLRLENQALKLKEV